jgi:hypothetical protein
VKKIMFKRSAVGLCVLVACSSSPLGSPLPLDAFDAGGAETSTMDSGREEPRDAALGTQSVLFVGNSYVYTNDVPGHYRALLAPGLQTVRTEMVAPGGYTLARHAVDAKTEGTPLAGFLRTGPRESNVFDAVILQEQSQIGGFQRGPEREASVAAAQELSQLAKSRGAQIILYNTWGRENGDPSEPSYETFVSMQDRLDEGYTNLATLLRANAFPVSIARVGSGFRIAFEDVKRAGKDPLAKGSDFDALYESDGSHPSVQGAYLAACILSGTIANALANPVKVEAFVDEPALGAPTSKRLRDVCIRALAR